MKRYNILNSTPKLKTTQRLRVIVNGVSFYTTARQVRNGVGDRTTINVAVRYALDKLEQSRAGALKQGDHLLTSGLVIDPHVSDITQVQLDVL